MSIRKLSAAAVILLAIAAPLAPARADEHDGVVKIKSAYPIAETVARIKKGMAGKGIRFFLEIDQSQLAAEAEIKLRPSTLLVFGNPALGTRFITANPLAGLDWPVRLLVTQDDDGTVWAAYTDFDWIAQRHRIRNRAFEFKMADDVITSITSSVQAP
jgi:uncharacterized protein (DUF302 family)